MKRTFLSLLVIALCTLTSYAQELNIYASGLSAGGVDNTAQEVKISYTLNAPATALSVIFQEGTGTPVEVAVTDPTALTKGAHADVTVDLSAVPTGNYAWSIKATGAANEATEPGKISNDDSKFKFYFPVGLVVDNSFESPFFGRIYLAEGAGSDCEANAATYFGDNRITYDGIYIFDALLNTVNTENAYTGNIAWETAPAASLTFSGNGTSPGRLSVDATGKVYIADNSLTNSGVFILDPAHPENNFTSVFAADSRDAAGLSVNHGRVPALYVEGSGDNTVLYTIDRNYVPADFTLPIARKYLSSGMAFKYNIGSLATPYSSLPEIIYDNPVVVTEGTEAGSAKLSNDAMTLISDGRDGFWICQNRSTDAAGMPCILHVNASGTEDYNTASASLGLSATARGAMAINREGTLLAISSNKYIKFFEIAYDSETGVPSLTASTIASINIAGTNIDGLAFDVAGNIYATSASKERFYVFALPKAENTFTTPAPAASIVTVENIPSPPQLQLTTQYTKTDYTWNTGNVSRDAAVYDGKVYAIDNSGKIHVIDGATGDEDASGLITNAALNCFGISSDGAGKLYVPTGNTGGGSNFSISTVDLLNANTVTTLAYADESGTVGSGKRSDYIEVYKVDGTATYIAGPSTNATPHLRIWSTDGTTVTTPIVSADINYKDDGTINNNNTGGDVTWIDATHLITTGQGNIPQYVTIDPAAGTATHEPIGTATTPFGGSAYFVLKGTPYLVLTDGGLGAIKVFDITDKTAPVEVASAPAIGSAGNATIHVGIDAFVAGDVATIYVWSPNNGLAVHKLAEGQTGIPAVEVAQAVTITVKAYELEVKTAGNNLAGYALYSIDGRLVRSAKANGTSASIAIGHLPQGIYVLQVSTSTGVVTRKFMKH